MGFKHMLEFTKERACQPCPIRTILFYHNFKKTKSFSIDSVKKDGNILNYYTLFFSLYLYCDLWIISYFAVTFLYISSNFYIYTMHLIPVFLSSDMTFFVSFPICTIRSFKLNICCSLTLFSVSLSNPAPPSSIKHSV